jgi:MtN3 and saliva related transmembrane protein
MDTHATLVGSVAAILTTIAFIPQVIKVWKTRSARDVSLGMYALFTTGVALWLAYGLMIESGPVIVANAMTLLLAGAVLVMKLRFDGRN